MCRLKYKLYLNIEHDIQHHEIIQTSIAYIVYYNIKQTNEGYVRIFEFINKLLT